MHANHYSPPPSESTGWLNFAGSLNKMLTDRLVCGVNNEGKFLAEQDLTYERACLAITQGSEEAAPLGKPSATVVVVANTEIVTYRESSRSGYATHIDN